MMTKLLTKMTELQLLADSSLSLYKFLYKSQSIAIIVLGILALSCFVIFGTRQAKRKAEARIQEVPEVEKKLKDPFLGLGILCVVLGFATFWGARVYVSAVTAEAPTIQTAYLNPQGELKLFVTHHRKVKHDYESVRLEVSSSEKDWTKPLQTELDPKDSTAETITFEKTGLPDSTFRLYARVVSVKDQEEFISEVTPFGLTK